jgi:hypothetical protein
VAGYNLTHCGGEVQPVVIVQPASIEGHLPLLIAAVGVFLFFVVVTVVGFR